jgi:hypothetical protein
MIKPFLFLSFLLTIMVFSMGVHHLQFTYDTHKQNLHELTQLTHIVKLSHSTAYDEATHNKTYPDMPSLGRLDFIYE